MKIKATSLYQLHEHKKAIIVYYCILFGVYILLMSTLTISISSSGNSSGSAGFNGIEFSTGIFAFVCGCIAFKEGFGMLLQNGISRRTLFISRCITTVILAFILSTADKIVLFLFKTISYLTNDNLSVITLYEQLYLKKPVSTFSLKIQIASYFFSVFLYLGVLAFGYLISLIYYRLRRAGKIALNVSVPVGLFIVIPLVDSHITNGQIWSSFVKFIDFSFGFSSSHPMNAMITCSIVFLLFSCFTWLMVRRAAFHD